VASITKAKRQQHQKAKNEAYRSGGIGGVK
jgi:hypothetical protein